MLMITMFFLFINFVLSSDLAYLVVINKPIKTYLNNVEEKVTNAMLPLELKDGLELKFEEDAYGQIYLNKNSVVYIAPYSQVSFEKIGGGRYSIKLRYGSLYYLGNFGVEIESRGIKAMLSGGDFVYRYNRSKLNGTLFNFTASRAQIYHSWDKKTYEVKAGQAFTVYSYASSRNINNLNNKIISDLKKHFRTDFVPGGKTLVAENLLNIDLTKHSLPNMKGNIDYIRRLVNIF